MDAPEIDAQRDFVTRQYASLVANGMSVESAMARLQEVLGKTAVEFLEPDGKPAEAGTAGAEDVAAQLANAAADAGGNPADTRAAFMHSVAEAKLFALDWWRPIRTFLLYVLFLLAVAVAIAVLYAAAVLPSFRSLDQTMAVSGGAASRIMAHAAIRLFAPLILMAILLALLLTLWRRMRLCMAALRPLPGSSRFAWLFGGGADYRALLYLEYASALTAGGAGDAAVLAPARVLVGRHAETLPPSPGNTLDEKLEQAVELGTFASELDWQRRLHWSLAQSQLEMSRDRLILFSRVLFYILIGYMVTVLYLPIFSVANTFWVH